AATGRSTARCSNGSSTNPAWRPPSCRNRAHPNGKGTDMAFKFNMRRIEKDPSGYYHPRWDRATPVSVIAENESEAFKKVWALSGETNRYGWVWTAIIDSIEEVPVSSTPEQ